MYRVEITPRPADQNGKPSLTVQPFVTVAGKEHKMRFAWGLKADSMALAKRLKRAVEAGVVFAPARLERDVYGEEYATADFANYVRGRALNADLRRLGF